MCSTKRIISILLSAIFHWVFAYITLLYANVGRNLGSNTYQLQLRRKNKTIGDCGECVHLSLIRCCTCCWVQSRCSAVDDNEWTKVNKRWKRRNTKLKIYWPKWLWYWLRSNTLLVCWSQWDECIFMLSVWRMQVNMVLAWCACKWNAFRRILKQ